MAAPNGIITRDTIAGAMQKVLERDGGAATLQVLERLTQRGFEVARASGASLSPFIGASLERPPVPERDDLELWDTYAEELSERIVSRADYANAGLGPQLLAVKSGAQGLRQLTWLIGPRGTARDVRGNVVIVRHGYSEGLTPEEMYACVVGAREALAQVVTEWEQMGQGVRDRSASRGFNVLARARRSKHPGIVFARAAAAGEIDPLADVDSRLLVGLPVPAKM